MNMQIFSIEKYDPLDEGVERHRSVWKSILIFNFNNDLQIFKKMQLQLHVEKLQF